jgi:hypothetical protein
MSAPVLKLTDRIEDVRYEDVMSTLTRAVAYNEPGGEYEREGFQATKAVVLLVDERGGRYDIRIVQSQTKMSDSISLLELAKFKQMQTMFGG